MAQLPRTMLMATLMTACVGCLQPDKTRLPTWWPAHPFAERAAFQRHDPFPDRDLGPEMHARPRGYNQTRAEARRAAELRVFRGMDGSIGPTAPTLPQSRREYPGLIRQ